jgi:hypothetical protein
LDGSSSSVRPSGSDPRHQSPLPAARPVDRDGGLAQFLLKKGYTGAEVSWLLGTTARHRLGASWAGLYKTYRMYDRPIQ